MGITITMDSPHDLDELRQALNKAYITTEESARAPRINPMLDQPRPRKQKKVAKKKRATTKKKTTRKRGRPKKTTAKKTTAKKTRKKVLHTKQVNHGGYVFALSPFPPSLMEPGLKGRTLKSEMLTLGKSRGYRYAVWVSRKTGHITGTQKLKNQVGGKL